MAMPWRTIHLAAATEAARAHRDLAIDTSQRIDPFAALEKSGIFAMRRRLDGLAGLYIPAEPNGDGLPGVLINAAHPLSKQRFTAAHELSHHRRDHAVVFDEDTEWFGRGGRPASDRERFAEAFAAWFLMPKRLVQATLTSLGLQANDLSPKDAYALSLELGTSYAATVHHLSNMGLISRSHRERLNRVQPRSIKQSLGVVEALADSWKNAWVLRGLTKLPIARTVQEGDAIVVEVPESPSSGYLWQPATVSPGLALIKEEYLADHPEQIGGKGLHRFLYRVDTSGQQRVELEMRRPWLNGPPVETWAAQIRANPQPTPGLVFPGAALAARN